MKYFFPVLILIFITACNDDTPTVLSVHQFVEDLKNGKYESSYIPAFKKGDIPLLLNYANDFQEIPRFPVNPISSYHSPNFRLGECLLWTIESIKKSYDNEDMMLKFPSLVPMLIKRGSENNPESGMLNEEELYEVYGYYLNWWQQNPDKDFESFRFINPLEGTDYSWK